MRHNTQTQGEPPWLIVCPGSHPSTWTAHWQQALRAIAPDLSAKLHISPAQPAWAAYPLRQWLMEQLGKPSASLTPIPLIYIIAFSAGCVAAQAIAHYAPQGGYRIGAIFAWDGWGVPLAGPFPVHRLSHDRFTHHTSYQPQIGPSHCPHFYADPAVTHAELWRSPHQAQGWQLGDFSPYSVPSPRPTTALAFQVTCLQHYGLLNPHP